MPCDCDQQKVRCCTYTVVAEFKGVLSANAQFLQTTVDKGTLVDTAVELTFDDQGVPEGFIRCPGCNEEHALKDVVFGEGDEAKLGFCPLCGTQLGDIKQPEPEAETVECDNCGAEYPQEAIDNGQQFCTKCGAELDV